MKSVFDRPVSRLSTAMKRINELECMSIETFRPEMQINFLKWEKREQNTE